MVEVLLALAVIASLCGIVGTVVPAVPGPIMCLASLLMLWFMIPEYVSTVVLIVMIVVTVIVSILDYIAPMMITKFGGGSKKAMWGVTAGTVVGLFYLPYGLILGPLIGAFIGEYLHIRKFKHALKIAALSFVSFLYTTGFKLIACLLMTFFVCKAVVCYAIDIWSKA